MDAANENVILEKELEIKPNIAMKTETGEVSALKIRECKKSLGEADSINMLLKSISLNEGQGLMNMPKPDENQESDHEVFIGYQSGAVGMFKIWIKAIIIPEDAKKEPDPADPTIEMCHKIYIAPQKITADVDMKHVLAM